jgi:transposase
MPRQRKYPEELLDRGARLVFESGRPVTHVAPDLGIPSETLRKWVRQAEADAGKRKELLSSEERQELGRLRGRADLRHPGGVGLRLLRARQGQAIGTLDRGRAPARPHP